MTSGKIKVNELQSTYQTGNVTSGLKRAQGAQTNNGQVTFKDLLEKRIGDGKQQVRFSAHAVERLASRNISLTENELSRLNTAVDKMEQKGSKDSLLLMGDLAFVVSVKNKTVVTAMDKAPGIEDKVFTNIDSAMIM
jgi:flagellar operon protein